MAEHPRTVVSRCFRHLPRGLPGAPAAGRVSACRHVTPAAIGLILHLDPDPGDPGDSRNPALRPHVLRSGRDPSCIDAAALAQARCRYHKGKPAPYVVQRQCPIEGPPVAPGELGRLAPGRAALPPRGPYASAHLLPRSSSPSLAWWGGRRDWQDLSLMDERLQFCVDRLELAVHGMSLQEMTCHYNRMSCRFEARPGGNSERSMVLLRATLRTGRR